MLSKVCTTKISKGVDPSDRCKYKKSQSNNNPLVQFTCAVLAVTCKGSSSYFWCKLKCLYSHLCVHYIWNYIHISITFSALTLRCSFLTIFWCRLTSLHLHLTTLGFVTFGGGSPSSTCSHHIVDIYI